VKTKTVWKWATPVVALILSSCATQYHAGVQPVSPMPPRALVSEKGLPKVASLQPTLSWKCDDASNAQFDLIIYTAVAKSAGKMVWWYPGDQGLDFYVPGVQVYYREGIDGFSHRLGQPLKPNTAYVWAVRTRRGTDVGQWATYDFERGGKALSGGHGFLGKHGSGMAGHNLWWSFRTPKD
jgi:hypothetical protein